MSPSFACLRRTLERTGVEGLVQVGIGKPVEGQLQFLNGRTRHPLERIEFRPARTENAVRIDQLEHRNLLLVFFASRRCHRAEPPSLASSAKAATTGACATSRAT